MERAVVRFVVVSAFASVLCGGALVMAGGQAATSTHLTISPTSAALGHLVTLTATVTPATATGTVTFYDGTSPVGLAAISNGEASLETRLLPAGARQLSARYNGSAAANPSISSVHTLTVSAAAAQGFSSPVAYGALTTGGVAVADFNADGFADVATIVHGLAGASPDASTGTLRILLGGGNGSLVVAATAQLSNSGLIATGDFNGDGHADVITSDAANMWVLFGNGAGAFFDPTPPISLGVEPTAFAVSDFNDDGRADIAALAASGTVTVALGDINGLRVLAPIATAADPRAIAVADLNRDGRADIIVGTGSGAIGTLHGNGDGTFQSGVTGPTLSNAGIRAIAAADLTGDGITDLAIANHTHGSVTILPGAATAGFSGPQIHAVPSPVTVAVADVNGDGALDIATASDRTPGIALLLASAGGFVPAHFGSGVAPRFLAASELNGDGRVDLISAAGSPEPLRVLFGSAFGVSASPNPSVFGQMVTLSARADSGATGIVTFFDGDATIGSTPMLSGQATLTAQALTVGLHTVRAEYSGDATHPAASASVDLSTRGHVNVQLDSTLNPSKVFDAVSIVAVVFTAGDAVVPTGTVTFTSSNGESATVALAGGVAQWQKDKLRPGTHLITARYNGDASFAPATSGVLTQTVTSETLCRVESAPNPSRLNEAVTLTAECANAIPEIELAPTGSLGGEVTDLGFGFVRRVRIITTLETGTHTFSVKPGPGAPHQHAVYTNSVRVVTTDADGGPGSLRQAVADAAPGDTILFASGFVIRPTSAIEITKPLTINGPRGDIDGISVILDGQNARRLLIIRSGGVTVRGLVFTRGNSTGGRGGDGFAGGGGGAGLGGAVFVATTDGAGVLFDNNEFIANNVLGGRGGNGQIIDSAHIGSYGSGGGGGLDGDGGFYGFADDRGLGGSGGVLFGDGGSAALGLGYASTGLYGGGGGGGLIRTHFQTGEPMNVVHGFGGGAGGAQRTPNYQVERHHADGLGGDGGVASISRNCFLDLGNFPVCSNTAYAGGSGGGGAGLGGAVFVKTGRVVFTNNSFLSNRTTGGDPGITPPPPYGVVDSHGAPATRGTAQGGAIYTSTTGTIALGTGNIFGGNVGEGGSSDVGGLPSQIEQPTGFFLKSPWRLTAQPGRPFNLPVTVQRLRNGAPSVGDRITFEITGAHFADGSRSAAFMTDANGSATSPPIIADLVAGKYVGAAVLFGSRVEFVLDVVEAAASTVTLQQPGNDPTALLGSTGSITAVVTRTPAGTAGGAVELLDGVRVIASAPFTGSPVTFSTSHLAAGYHYLRAIYTGDVTTQSSVSPGLWHLVTARPAQEFSTAWTNALPLPARHLILGSFISSSRQAATIVDGGFMIAVPSAGAAVIPYGTVETPTQMIAGDFDGDRYTDLAVLVPGVNPLKIYNGGPLGMTMSHEYPVNAGASLAAADFNADGRLDLVAAGPGDRIETWFGNSDGTLQLARVTTTGFPSAFDDIVVDDFNVDGIADLALLDRAATRSLLVAGDGFGAFAYHSQTAFGYSTSTGMVSGDFDGNGWPDLATVQAEGSVVAFFGPFHPLSGSSQRESLPPSFSDGGAGIAASDLDGDGFDDLVITRDLSNTIAVMRSRGDGTFYSPRAYPAGSTPNAVAIAELTGDSRADILVVSGGGTLELLAGAPGVATVAWPQPHALAPGMLLGFEQLNATASEAGTFHYTPVAGTPMSEGLHTLSVTFTARDPGKAPITASTPLWVRAAAITWVPEPGLHNQPISAAQLNATANVAGTFSYSRAVGDVLIAASHPTHVHFEPADRFNWAPADLTVNLEIRKLDPQLTWDPAPIPFGFNLGPQQLNATAAVPGTFVYTPDERFVPAQSGPLQVTVSFMPHSASIYLPVTRTVTIDVLPVPTTITQHPVSMVICEGQAATLTVAADASTLVYHWRRNGQLINDTEMSALVRGARSNTLTLTPSWDGTYDVLVNEVLSNAATLTTGYAPVVFISQPGMPLAGEILLIHASRSGFDRERTTMQWQYSVDGTTWVDIAGATGDDLQIPDSSIANNGFYRVVGTSSCGTAATAAVSIEVRKRTQTIAPKLIDVSGGVLTYGQTAALIGQASSGLPLSYTVLEGGVAIANGEIRATAVGAFKIKASQEGDDAFEPVEAEFSGEVQRANLIAHLQPARRVYGSPNPQPQFTFSGFVNGDTETVVSGDPSYQRPALDSSAGAASVSLAGELTAANYRISIDYSAAAFQIDQAPLTIKVHDKSKTYGDPTPPLTFEYLGLVLGETEPSVTNPIFLELLGQAGPDGIWTEPGTYAITATQWSQNYVITVEPATLTVVPAPLTIRAHPATRKYGQADPTFTATFEGFRNDDTYGALGEGFRIGTTATSLSPVGEYPIIIASPATLNRYAITFESAMLTIEPAPMGLAVMPSSKRYGAPNPEFEVVFSGLPPGEDVAALRSSVVFTTSATQSSAVGSYKVTPSLNSPNYFVLFLHEGFLSITRAPLSVRVADQTRNYGAATPFEVTYSGFVLGQDTSVLAGTLHFTGPGVSAPVGQYTVSPGGLTSSNYAITFIPGTVTIARAPLTLRADDVRRFYGMETGFTISYIGLAAFDNRFDIGGTVTTTATVSSVPGEYELIVTGGSSSNYDITRVNGTLTIDKMPLTIRPKTVSRLYGDPNPPSFAVDYFPYATNHVPVGLSGVQVTTTATQSSSRGRYPLIASGVSSPLYEITFLEGDLLVFRRELVVTGPSIAKTYGQPNPPLPLDQFTYQGFVLGDGPQVVTGTPRFFTDGLDERTPPGSYGVFFDGLSAEPNYHIVVKSAPFTIAPAPLVARLNDVTVNYGEAVPALTVSYEGFVLGQDASVVRGFVNTTPHPSQLFQAGEYQVVPSGLFADNYAIQYVPGTVRIKALPVTITAVDASRLYGQANPAFTVTYVGLRDGDNPLFLQQGALTFATAATTSSGVGQYEVMPGGVTLPNYDVQFVAGTLTVTPSPLTVRANSRTRRYGDVVPPYTVTYTGLVAGDGPGALGGTLTFDTAADNAGVGTYPIVPGGVTSSNYTIAFESGLLTVRPGILNVFANDATRLFGQPNPAFTARYEGFKHGDGPEVVSNLVVQSNATPTTPAGTYAIVAFGATAANYEIDYHQGSLTITRAALRVMADDVSRLYGDPNPAFTATYSGLAPGTGSHVHGTVTFTSAGHVLSPVGAYQLMPGGLFSEAYDIEYVPGTLTIEPRPLTVTAGNRSRPYGTPNPAFTVVYSGFRNGDTEASLLGSLVFDAPDASANVGVYPVVPSGFTSPNYVVTFVAGSLTITKVQPQVSWPHATVIPSYPQPLGADILRATSNVPGSFDYSPAAGTVLDPGCHQLSATFTPDDTTNYSPSQTGIALCVDRGVQTIQWPAPASLTYPEVLDASRLNAAASGPGGQTTGALSYFPAAGAILQGGRHTLRVTAAATPFYKAAEASVEIDVLPGVQTVTWPTAPAPMRYDMRLTSAQRTAIATGSGAASPGVITYSPASFVNGVGMQPLTATAAATNNYREATATAHVMVTKAPLSVGTMNGYGYRMTTDPPDTVTWFDFVSGMRETDSFRVGMKKNIPGGTPAGIYLPDFVFDDPAGRAANYEVQTFELFNVFNPIPMVTSIDRTSTVQGSGDLTLTIQGSGFVTSCGDQCPPVECEWCFVDTSGTTVRWNDLVLPATVMSAAELRVTIPAAQLAAPTVAYLTIGNWGSMPVMQEFFVTGADTTVTAASTQQSWWEPIALETGAEGEESTLFLETDEGGGTVTIAAYASNPAAGFVAGEHFFDVFVQPETFGFTQATIRTCPASLEASDRVFWYDGTQWLAASHQTFVSGPPSCIEIVVTDQTSPTLTQLTGTFFTVVKDLAPPAISVTIDRTSLWPPDGKLVPVVVSGRVTDASGISAVLYRVVDEYGVVQPSSAVVLSADGSYAVTVMLPADRKGSDKDGRVFTIRVEARDAMGNAAFESAAVHVPHDQRKK